MKQNITKEQWDEIDEGDRILWIKQFCIQTRTGVIPCSDDFKQDLFPTIGQMLEFLGDDWDEQVKLQAGLTGEYDGGDMPMNSALADTLWEAVKHKLT